MREIILQMRCARQHEDVGVRPERGVAHSDDFFHAVRAAYELRAALAEPFERLVDVVHADMTRR